MLRVLSDGDMKYRLEESDGMPMGWINGRAIGFRGFATEADARDAAVAAWRTLDGSLRRAYTGWPQREVAADRLRTVHDGAYEWLHDGAIAVARLLRPTRRAYDGSFGIELVLPTYASEGAAITAAHSIAFAIAPYRDVHRVPDKAGISTGRELSPSRDTPLSR